MREFGYHVNMVDLDASDPDTSALNEALELLHFGFRAITARPDARLAALGFSRVHHRILYFIARHPGCSVGELIAIMRVSKQYLHRPLRQLVDAGYVTIQPDEADRRIRRLGLTGRGSRLESALTGAQREQIRSIFKEAGAEAEAGWRRVMGLLAERLFDSASAEAADKS